MGLPRCPKCGSMWVSDMDEVRGIHSPHCLTCGAKLKRRMDESGYEER